MAIDWVATNARIHAEMRANLPTAVVTRRDGTQFSLVATDRRQNSGVLTDGIVQQDYVIRVIMPDWDNRAGGPPEQGDLIEFGGRRHRIESYHRHQIAQLYILRIRG